MVDFEPEVNESVNEKIIQLSSEDPKVRREAAYYLGEAGADDAIPRLVELYREDKNKGVRDAAAYALGMFKAVEAAQKSGKTEKLVALLTKVQEGKLGSRSRGAGLLKVDIGLLLLAVVLFALSFVVPGILKNVDSPTSEPTAVVSAPTKDRTTLLNEIIFYYTQLNTDATNLQQQYTTMLGSSPPNCSVSFSNPAEYTLSPGDAAAYPDIAQLVTALNGVRQTLATVKAPRDQACPPYGTPLPAANVGPLFVTLNQQVLGVLVTIYPQIGAALAVPTAPPPPTNAPLPTEGPAPTIGPTVAVANVASHIPALYSILETVQHDPGMTTLLVHYWTDSANPATQSSACLEPPPHIPDPYILPDVDAQASPSLKQVVENINNGLGLLQQGWTLLEQICVQKTWEQNARAGQNLAQTASQYFISAKSLLDTIRTGG